MIPDTSTRLRYYSLYLVAFANGAGLITITTLLPTYIDLLEPSGIAIGLFISGLTGAQAIAVIPLGWAGDRFDKRTILLATLLACIGAYALFPFVETSTGFIAVRFLQGLSVVGVSLLSLALIGELSSGDERANMIGKFNSWKLAAGTLGTLGAGALYDIYGFTVIFLILVTLFFAATLGTWRYIEPDGSNVSFAFDKLAVNRRILTMTSFRAQYALAVTFMRNWVPIFVGVSAAQGGLGFAAIIVGIVIATERFTNMLFQPFTGRLSDVYGRSIFIVIGGASYGLIAILVPFAPIIGSSLGLSGTYPIVGSVSASLIVVIALNALLGVADAFREPASMALFADEGVEQGGVASSFGIRSLVWRPGNVIAPMIGGIVMTQIGMSWVFFLAGFFALSGVIMFVGLLSYTQGRNALSTW
ncbi:MFS transporter [Halomontanus rarus]|uniref:MFS transporter n=1 Tax=Halomontanus rarus TaxID=3034020 RepID=UPI00293BD981|nr:MFS transporter [Halovivax sp. KZCA124]